MMNYYVEAILNELIKDDRVNSLEAIAKNNNRKVYLKGNEYQEYSMELVFLVDTGDLFKKTIAFSIITNSFSFDIEIIKHYSSEIQIFSRRPVKNVTQYIINKILIFKNQDSKNDNYLKVSNF